MPALSACLEGRGLVDQQYNKNRAGSETTQELLDRLDALLSEDWKVTIPGYEPVREQAPKVADKFPAQKKSRFNWRRGDWLILCHDLVYILAAVVLIFTFFVRMSRVEGNSMNPTLVNHDRMLLLSNVWYTDPQRGDIVVATVPAFSSEPIVKRIIAVEGDTVDIDFTLGVVYVNGVALEEPYIQEPTLTDFGSEGMSFPLVVENDHVFLMGDNRNDSYDSRYRAIGQVDQRCILGKVFFLTMPGVDPATGKRDFGRFGLTD